MFSNFKKKQKSPQLDEFRKNRISAITEYAARSLSFLTEPFLAAQLEEKKSITEHTKLGEAFGHYDRREELVERIDEMKATLPGWEKDVRKDVMAAYTLPECFGVMPNSTWLTSQESNSLPKLTQVYVTGYISHARSEFKSVKKQSEQYIDYLENVAKCASCPLFDRCAKISEFQNRNQRTDRLSDTIYDANQK